MKWLVIPDLQVPDHDRKFCTSVANYIAALKPDGLCVVGDELDAPEPSRWNKNFAGEYAGTLQASISECNLVLATFRDALGAGKPYHLMRSNHGDRIRTYINRYAPALASLESLEYQRLLGFDDIGITYHKRPFEFAPGWVLAHGDEGSLTQTPGGTALGLAKKWNKSVVCGHTHRAGLQHHHSYLNGKPSALLFGLEVGHGMDIKKADYLKAGSANWQQAIAVIDVDGRNVYPNLIPVFGSRVTVDGVTY
jgi:hypothetical protein